jgi:lysophospholipase L1-like esterase
MSIIRSDSRNETHNKPVQEGERKLSGGVYVDYVSTAEVIAAIGTEFRKNKYFWIAGSRYHCDSDGTTFRTAGISQNDLSLRDYYTSGDPLINYSLTTTGTALANAAYRCTDFIAVVRNQDIIYSGQVGATQVPICYYDTNKVFVSSPLAVNATYTNQAIKVPAGVAFVRMSSINSAPAVLFRINFYPPDPKNTANAALTPTLQAGIFNQYAMQSYAGKFAGLIDNTGAFVANASWGTTDFIAVQPGLPMQYKGLTISNFLPVAYYDTNKAFLFSGLTAGDYTAAFVNLLVPANISIAYVRMCGRVAEGFTFNVGYSVIPIMQASIFNLYYMHDYSAGSFASFIDTSGNLVTNANWLATDYVPVKAGYPIQYKGDCTSGVLPIAYYDSNKTFINAPLTGTDYSASLQTLYIPNNPSIAYVAMCCRTSTGKPHSFYVGEVPAGGTGAVPAPVFFLPAVAYAKQGELFRMYSFGIIAENSASKSTDAVWTTAGGCLDFWEITPGSADDNISVQLSARDAFNNLISCGSTTVKVTHTTQSPATAVNIICIGDSVTRGTNSTIEPNGAYPNEFARRLTGVGTAIPSTPSPAALAFTNIYFRGTLGSLTIKHEGRGSWSLYNYLYNASFSVNTNAFWNPGTSKFDLAYYLSQNNFNAAQTANGVDATGSNLVIYLMIGWNDIGASGYGVDQAGIYLNQMLDIIHTSHPNCKIKLLGLTQPASTFIRSGAATNSSKYWMNDKIVPLAKKWQSVADARSAYVEFIPNAPFFNPLECFVTISKKLHNRSNTNVNYVNELPHPNDQGYGQIADVAFMNFLYNYCRAT